MSKSDLRSEVSSSLALAQPFSALPPSVSRTPLPDDVSTCHPSSSVPTTSVYITENLCVLKSSASPSPNPHFLYHSDSQSQQEREMFQKGTSVSAIFLELQVVGSRPRGEVCCFCVSRGAGSQAVAVLSPLSLSQVGSQLHLQDFTTILERCSTLGVLPT